VSDPVPSLKAGRFQSAAIGAIQLRLPGSFSWRGRIWEGPIQLRTCAYGLRRGLLLVLIVFAAASVKGLNPKRNIDQYFHDAWTSQRGLPGEAVYQILQSPDGYLWLRTSAGLVRFDGVRFVLMNEVIGNEPVKAIAMNADGNVLIRTMSRTVLYRNGVFFDYLPPAPLPDGDIRVIFESREHQVFIGADDFIYAAQRDGIHLMQAHTAWVSAFLEDEKGIVWVGGTYDLYTYQDGNLRSAIKMGAKEGVSSLFEDHQHVVWAGTPHGLFRLSKDGTSLEPIDHSFFRGGVTRIIEDGQKNLWLGTPASGLTRMTGDLVSSFKFSDGLTDNKVLALFEDREGSLWVGTTSGLDRFRDTKITTLTVKEGLPSDDTPSAITAQDESIYVLCSDGGLARIVNDKVVSAVTRIPGLASIHGGALYEDKEGSLWLGTFGGLTRIKKGKITVYKSDPLLSMQYIPAINEDEEGLIAGTADLRIVRVKDGKAQPFTVHGKTTPLSSPGNYTFTIYRQPSGTLWFGTVGGLFKYAPGTIPVRQPRIDFPVTSISDDGQGSLWLGGRIPGTIRFRIRDGQVTHYTKRDGLFDEYSSRVLSDDKGGLWFSTSNGIYRAKWKDLDDLADGRISHVPSTVFGTIDGMKTSEATSSGFGRGGCKGVDGKLWFATVRGIVSIDPRDIPQNNLAPPVVIENLTVDNLQLPSNDNIQIPAGKNKIEFHYTALSFRVPERVRFKYRLEGYDSDWVDAGTRRVAYYNNLRPGKYRFRVIGDNDDGLWNEKGAVVGFTMKPHYYQTVWFYGICGLIFAVAIIAAHRFNTRRLRAKAQELTRIVKERTDTLRLEVLEHQRAKEAAVEAREAMRHQATHDDLTSLLNRGAILELLARELSRSGREKSFTGVIMADLDHFKTVNDMYGHLVGDEVLREVADRLLVSVRPYDLIGRYGGEEFLIVLNNCDADSAMERAEALRLAIAAVPVRTESGSIPVTMSIGIASQHWESLSTDEIVREADAALYAAKDAGRNCCRMASTNLSNLTEKA